MKKPSDFIFYPAALVMPLFFANILINHDDRMVFFVYVVVTIVLFFLYARTYSNKEDAYYYENLPKGKEESIIFYTGGLVQLYAIAQPFTVLFDLKAKYNRHLEKYLYPDVSLKDLGEVLCWSIVFFLIGRTFYAVFHELVSTRKKLSLIEKSVQTEKSAR